MRPDYVVQRETFPYHCVEFVAEGGGMLRLLGRDYPLRAGMVFAYAPRIPHTIRNDPQHPMRKYYVDFVGRENRIIFADETDTDAILDAAADQLVAFARQWLRG